MDSVSFVSPGQKSPIPVNLSAVLMTVVTGCSRMEFSATRQKSGDSSVIPALA